MSPRADQHQPPAGLDDRQNLYAIPTQKSVDRFKDQIRALTLRRIPLRLGELIETINPIIRGWGNYYCRSRVRKRFHQLDGWIIRRLWSHRAKRWRNVAWKEYPTARLRTEFKLVGLVSRIPSLQAARARLLSPSMDIDGRPRIGLESAKLTSILKLYEVCASISRRSC